MIFKQEHKPFHDIPHLHKMLPYVSYEEETQLFFNEGATGFVLRCQPLVGGSLEIQDQLAEFFRTKEHLPEGASLQVLLQATPHIEESIALWASKRMPSYHTFAKRRSAFLAEGKKAKMAPLRDYTVLLSLTVPELLESVLKKEAFLRTLSVLTNTLKLLGMSVEVLDAQGLIKEVGTLLNGQSSGQSPNVSQSSSWNPLERLSTQIISPDLKCEVRAEGVILNNRIFQTFIPKSAPDYWSLPCMDLLLGDLSLIESFIPCPFFMHYGLHVLSNQQAKLAKQLSKRGALENALKNALTKWMPGIEEQFAETSAAVKELQKGERLVASSLSCTLICPTQDIDNASAQLKNIWARAEWGLVPATYDHFNFLLSSLPMMWTLGKNRRIEGWGPDLAHMGKAKKSITKESQNLLPLLGEWKGQEAPGIPLSGRRGQLFFWNPFGTSLLPGSHGQTDHNFNVCLAGQSGSGKSVFAQELMMNILSVGGQVFVLDYGRSFKKACQLMKGQYIEFDVSNPLSLNPFTHIEGDPQEMLACLKPTVQAMAGPKHGTTDLQNAFIEKAIRHAWETQKNACTIEDIRAFLLSHENNVARDLGEALYPFGAEGVYGKFFQGKAEATLNKDFVVIETDHLRSHPDLLTVLVQMVMIHIHQTMSRGSRDRPTMIMIDEAWKLLAGKSTGAFIAEINRISRKYKVTLVLATQHMTDYFNPDAPAATEAFNTAAWKVMLYQEADVIHAFHDHPQLKSFVSHKGQEKLLKSLRSLVPYFSEAAFYGPGVQGAIGRLSLDPYAQLLYSTNAQEYQALEKRVIQEGMNVNEAIEDYLAKREAMREAGREVRREARREVGQGTKRERREAA